MLIPRFIVRLDILELKNICLTTIKKHILKFKITRKLYGCLWEIRVIYKTAFITSWKNEHFKNFKPNPISVVVLKCSIVIQCFSGMAKHIAKIPSLYHWAGRVPSDIQCSYFCLSYHPFMCSCWVSSQIVTPAKPSQNIHNKDFVALVITSANHFPLPLYA